METLHCGLISSDVGQLTACVSDKGLCGLEFDLPERQTMLARRVSKRFSSSQSTESGHALLDDVKVWLKHYFSGRFSKLERLSLDLRGTDFERQVWGLLLQIPVGSTLTYGEL